MCFKALTLFLAIGAVFGAATPPAFRITEETTLAEFLLNSPTMRGAETFNWLCWDYYLPELKNHADQYDADNKLCEDNYYKAEFKIDTSYTIVRNDLIHSVSTTCNNLLTCDNEQTNADAFQCLIKPSSDASKTLTGISNNATDSNTSLLADIAAIDATFQSCRTEAQRTYRANHEECLENLDGCLDDPDWNLPTTNVY
ncbi:hypothetical protein KR009_006233 [Drosophila setifemur]|nr:hypothetical protein KR009_006233 [Drosophila setifemur]